MIILILFQSVFFQSGDVLYGEPDGMSNFSGEPSADGGDFILYNNIRYKPDKFFILAVISNICAFLLPAAFYVRLKGAGYTKNLKFERPKLKYLALSI